MQIFTKANITAADDGELGCGSKITFDSQGFPAQFKKLWKVG